MNIQAKKSLGQNFLKSKSALNKMLEAGEVTADDIVLEVGPGKGILTEKLLEKAKKVIAVEKDDRLIPILQEKFANEITANRLEVIHGDILDYESKETGYKLIANIPYYITGQFLRKFLEEKNSPERIVIMVQKEIAQRITARNGKESLLSISVKAYGTPKIIMKVNKENFSPAPKVDSAILLISNISKNFFTEMDATHSPQENQEKFFKILRAGFAHKRKMLISNLRAFFPETNWTEIFTASNLSPKIRAEELSLLQWKCLL